MKLRSNAEHQILEPLFTNIIMTFPTSPGVATQLDSALQFKLFFASGIHSSLLPVPVSFPWDHISYNLYLITGNSFARGLLLSSPLHVSVHFPRTGQQFEPCLISGHQISLCDALFSVSDIAPSL